MGLSGCNTGGAGGGALFNIFSPTADIDILGFLARSPDFPFFSPTIPPPHPKKKKKKRREAPRSSGEALQLRPPSPRPFVHGATVAVFAPPPAHAPGPICCGVLRIAPHELTSPSPPAFLMFCCVRFFVFFWLAVPPRYGSRCDESSRTSL